RNIELIRYRRFGDDLLMLELVHAPKVAKIVAPAAHAGTQQVSPEAESDPYVSQRIAYRISQADPPLLDLFEAVKQFLSGLGDDVQVKELKNYIAFKRLKNFACVEVYPQHRLITVYPKVDPKTVILENGFSRDVTKIGHTLEL